VVCARRVCWLVLRLHSVNLLYYASSELWRNKFHGMWKGRPYISTNIRHCCCRLDIWTRWHRLPKQKRLFRVDLIEGVVRCALVQALKFCTDRTAHRGSTCIALLFPDHGTRRGWGVSVTPRPLFTPWKDTHNWKYNFKYCLTPKKNPKWDWKRVFVDYDRISATFRISLVREFRCRSLFYSGTDVIYTSVVSRGKLIRLHVAIWIISPDI